MITHYRNADLDAVLHAVTRLWTRSLVRFGANPDRAMDILLNHWLLYQHCLAECGLVRLLPGERRVRISRSAPGRDGAYCVQAGVTREHLLRAAARQFVEGDVQHWWHPPSGKGVRTRISDDRIWLAYATAHYVAVTGDAQILDEMVPFLDGPVLHDQQLESYFQPTISEVQGTLFETLRARP